MSRRSLRLQPIAVDLPQTAGGDGTDVNLTAIGMDMPVAPSDSEIAASKSSLATFLNALAGYRRRKEAIRSAASTLFVDLFDPGALSRGFDEQNMPLLTVTSRADRIRTLKTHAASFSACVPLLLLCRRLPLQLLRTVPLRSIRAQQLPTKRRRPLIFQYRRGTPKRARSPTSSC
jgi:hypothetical protein